MVHFFSKTGYIRNLHIFSKFQAQYCALATFLNSDSPSGQIVTPRVLLRGHCHRSFHGVGNAASAATPLRRTSSTGKNVLLHTDPFSEALRYPFRGYAHFMSPHAFSMASVHGPFSGPDLQKTRISHIFSLDARPTG